MQLRRTSVNVPDLQHHARDLAAAFLVSEQVNAQRVLLRKPQPSTSSMISMTFCCCCNFSSAAEDASQHNWELQKLWCLLNA